MNFKVTAFTETKKLHYTRISAHVSGSIVFAQEDRLVDVYVNLLTCITDMYIIVSGYYICVRGYRISKKSDLVNYFLVNFKFQLY